MTQVIWYKFIYDSRHVPVFKEVITEAFIKPINNKTVKKYRKKPVVIEAEQFVVYSQNEHPISKTVNGITFPVYKDDKGFHILIPTMEGTMRADNLDWIIRGINGEIYPCKPDIFEKTYEPTHNDIQ